MSDCPTTETMRDGCRVQLMVSPKRMEAVVYPPAESGSVYPISVGRELGKDDTGKPRPAAICLPDRAGFHIRAAEGVARALAVAVAVAKEMEERG